MTREWLTLDEKKEKLNNMYNELKDKDLDLAFLPYLEKINQLSGICTTQSCTGHRNRESKEGYISLRFDYKTHELFMDEIFRLLKIAEIFNIQEHFEIFGKKVRQRTVIEFKYYRWRKTIEKIIKILKKIEKKQDLI